MAYHYKYDLKLRKKVKSRPLQFGSIIHQLMEAYYEGEDVQETFDEINRQSGKMFAEEREVYGNIMEAAITIFNEYMEHYEKSMLKPIRWRKQWAEHWFEVEIASDIVLVGKIDLIAKTANKQKGLVEIKTFNRMPSAEFRWKNTQAMSYVKVIQMLGGPSVDIVVWDYVHSKEPSVPKLLKKGGFSTAPCNTLPSVLMETAQASGIEVKPTDLIYKMAMANRNSYFERVVNPIRQTVVDAVFEELVASAKALRDEKDRPPFRSIDRHCDWCDYSPLCRADITGGDVEFVKKGLYQIETKDHKDPNDSESE